MNKIEINEAKDWNGGYQTSSLLIFAEEIYKIEGEIQKLKLELADEEFHLKYIPVRKERIIQRLRNHLKYHIIFCIVIISSAIGVANTIFSLLHGRSFTKSEYVNSFSGMILLVCFLFVVFGSLFYCKFILIDDVRDYRLLRVNDIGLRSMKDEDAFRVEYEKTKSKVDFLNDKINCLINEKEKVKKKKEICLSELKNKDEKRQEKSNTNEKMEGTQSFFSLKKSDIDSFDVSELFEYYQREESYYKSYLMQLEDELTGINREIVGIQERFCQTRKEIIIFLLIFVLVIGIQQFTSGIAATITSIICLFGFGIAIVRLERKMTPSILDYLIEEEHAWVSEYAFKQNRRPLKFKCKEIQDEILHIKDRIKDIQESKKELDF